MFSSLQQMEDSVGRALGRVTVYSIQGCPHCLQAKATLGRLEVPVCEVDLGRHPELRATVKELTGRSTVPQIFFNSVHVGGNDDLQKLVRSWTTQNSFHISYHLNLCLSLYTFLALSQAPEELQRLVRLVREEALPADAPPLPEENQSEDGADDTSGGETSFYTAGYLHTMYISVLYYLVAG